MRTVVLQHGKLPSKPKYSELKHISAKKPPACPKGYNTFPKKKTTLGHMTNYWARFYFVSLAKDTICRNSKNDISNNNVGNDAVVLQNYFRECLMHYDQTSKQHMPLKNLNSF